MIIVNKKTENIINELKIVVTTDTIVRDNGYYVAAIN